MKLSNLNATKSSAPIDQISNEIPKDMNNLYRDNKIYIATNNESSPKTTGIIVAELEAVCAVCVHPIKNKEMTVVEGIPAIIPPIFDPNFSAIIVAPVIHVAPTTNARINLMVKASAMNNRYYHIYNFFTYLTLVTLG